MPYSKTEYLLSQEDGKFRLSVSIPAGTILNGRTMILVEGPGWDFAPDEPMEAEELDGWIKGVRAKGYRVTASKFSPR